MSDTLVASSNPHSQDSKTSADAQCITSNGLGHAVIILESLRSRCLPRWLDQCIKRTYQHWLGGSRLTTIAILAIPAPHVRDAAEQIAKLLRPCGFYAHIVWQGQLIVIFPNAVFEVAPADTVGLASLRTIGREHGIPERQMRFEDLITTDHPNDARDQSPPLLNPIAYFCPTDHDDHPTEKKRCGRVVNVTEDGLNAEVTVNGTPITVLFPNMPGPTVGDIIGCIGQFHEDGGKQVLHVTRWATLTPTQRPDLFTKEIPGAPREIVLLRDPALRRAIDVRRHVVKTVRRFLDERGFLEMDTPIVLPVRDIAPVPHFSVTPSSNGAAVLRICPENALKRLVVAGFDRVYEIARNFRIEGATHERSPEFTTLECYRAFTTYHQTMELCQDLILAVIHVVTGGKDTLQYQDKIIDIRAPWERWDFQAAVRRDTGIDLEQALDVQTLRYEMERRGITAQDLHSRRTCVNHLAEIVESQIVNPTFLIDHPAETICVAERHDAPRAHLLQRFELFIGGMEIAHAFAELTNAQEQRERMQELMREKILAGEDAHPLDDGFLTALDIGLPPTGGLGIGIDRLVMLLTGEPIDRVMAFPITL